MELNATDQPWQIRDVVPLPGAEAVFGVSLRTEKPYAGRIGLVTQPVIGVTSSPGSLDAAVLEGWRWIYQSWAGLARHVATQRRGTPTGHRTPYATAGPPARRVGASRRVSAGAHGPD